MDLLSTETPALHLWRFYFKARSCLHLHADSYLSPNCHFSEIAEQGRGRVGDATSNLGPAACGSPWGQ